MYGGTVGLRDQGGLASALAMPHMSAFGQDVYPEIIDQAAAYLYYVTKAHAFVDGNKRTASRLCLDWLALHYLSLADEDAFFALVIDVAASGIGIKEVIQRLQDMTEDEAD